MNLKFDDSNIALIYVQKKLKEQYNPNVIINGKYYKRINSDYGFAHFIARYLEAMYPPLGTTDYDSLDAQTFKTQRNLTDVVSIANYFLCNNKGNKLIVPDINANGQIPLDLTLTVETKPYIDMYGYNIKGIINSNDLPLFLNSDTDFEHISLSVKDAIFYMYEWNTSKDICEIDDYIMSFLLGRVIGPNSSMDEIYYAQQLLINTDKIAITDRGKWESNSINMTEAIIEYQRKHINIYDKHPLIVTGYMDIFTEGALLKSRGEQQYGIHGL